MKRIPQSDTNGDFLPEIVYKYPECFGINSERTFSQDREAVGKGGGGGEAHRSTEKERGLRDT